MRSEAMPGGRRRHRASARGDGHREPNRRSANNSRLSLPSGGAPLPLPGGHGDPKTVPARNPPQHSRPRFASPVPPPGAAPLQGCDRKPHFEPPPLHSSAACRCEYVSAHGIPKLRLVANASKFHRQALLLLAGHQATCCNQRQAAKEENLLMARILTPREEDLTSGRKTENHPLGCSPGTHAKL